MIALIVNLIALTINLIISQLIIIKAIINCFNN